MDFTVCVFNIMIPILPPLKLYGQYERVQKIGAVIEELDNQFGLDVVVLNEVIPIKIQKVIRDKMGKLGYKYSSTTLSVF